MISSSFQVSTQYLFYSYISWAPPKVKLFMWLLLHMDHGWLLKTADRSEHLHGPQYITQPYGLQLSCRLWKCRLILATDRLIPIKIVIPLQEKTGIQVQHKLLCWWKYLWLHTFHKTGSEGDFQMSLHTVFDGMLQYDSNAPCLDTPETCWTFYRD